jgi:hypothetical protein
MMMRQALRTGRQLTSLTRFSFSNPFFSKTDPAVEQPSEAKATQAGERGKEGRDAREGAREALTAMVDKINAANKYFLGVKLNTNYLKVSKEVKYEEVAKLTTDKTTVNDLPIEISKKNADYEAFEKTSQEAALSQKSGQIVFSRARVEPTLLKMQQIIREFMVGIAQKARLASVEPNFEIQCIKAVNSLDPKLQLNLSNEEALPEVRIKSVTLLKGLTAYRNDNYSTDSFEKDEQELSDGIVTYKLYRQLKEEYPEVEWFSTKRINARFELLVKGGPTITILESGNNIGSTANLLHTVVIETDLVPPPPNAETQLSADQL